MIAQIGFARKTGSASDRTGTALVLLRDAALR